MALEIADLIALEERLEREADRIHKEREAVKILKARLIAEKGDQASQTSLELNAPKPHTFAEAVRQAVQSFGDQQFTMRNVESVLQARAVALPDKNPRIRIGNEVREMLRRGEITLAERGSGTTPFKYKLTKPQPEKGEGAERSRAQAPSITNLRH